MEGYKVFTRDLRSPIRGGAPVWDGTLPSSLPTVALDTSDAECSHGWNFARSIEDGLRIAGLWPDGYPSRVFRVTGHDAIERGDKLRASTLTLLHEVPETEIAAAIARWTATWAGDLTDIMTAEQLAWRRASARPDWDETRVESGLTDALRARGLPWRLRKFETARDAWAARDAWVASAARDAWPAWDAWRVWDTWDTWPAWDAWRVCDALGALKLQFTARRGWVRHDPGRLTTGIRDAYAAGLAVAVPTAPHELGWAMVER